MDDGTILVGKLTDKVTLFHFKNGVLAGKFHILFEDSNRRALVPCLAYNGFAKSLAEHAHKGQELDLAGSYDTGSIFDFNYKNQHTYFNAARIAVPYVAGKE